MIAYLVIREGLKWTDVFRLIPGRTVTVGRAPTNQIVIKDERCSRHHAEIFLTQGQWTLRDLDSRNGTLLGDKSVRGDVSLVAGNVIQIAHAQMAFVNDLSAAFADSSTTVRENTDLDAENDDENVLGAADGSSVLSDVEPTTITHRKGQTKFLEPPAEGYPGTSRLGQAAAKLCRLAFELANQADMLSVSNLALGGLLESTQVDAGAVLLLSRDFEGVAEGQDLEVVASLADSEASYHRISDFLATTVLQEGEALLARNVEDDSMLSVKDSKGELHATSIICAPIREGKRVVGLIHLYSTSSMRVPDPDDLEFTLAVADNVALGLKNLNRQQELTENLTLTQDEIVQLRERLGAENEIVGASEPMHKVHQEIERAAPSRATVLIRGESGVGKELVARAVHFASPRRKGPFVCLNCAALSETLLESELFGHERGAFTGATERKIGKFEAADDGTIMLDEIGEMSPNIQAKFLRVLEGHPYERVGGSEAIKVDVRVIAATNRDLEKDVSVGNFRRDLYFRLHVLEIRVPSLRKRTSDVIELANHFLRRFNIETGRRIHGFTPEALDRLQRYRWPGNVRELKNVIERAVVLTRSDSIDVTDLMLSNLATAGDTAEIVSPLSGYEPTTLDEVERRHILATLQNTGGNKSRAAKILGIERSTLDRKIRRYEMDSEIPRRGHSA